MNEKYTKAFTLVFEGDIRKFKMNPLTTETPWGIPYAVMAGDALEQLDEALGIVTDLPSEDK